MIRMDKEGSIKIARTSLLGVVAIAAACLARPAQVMAQGWPSYGHDQQHTCQSVAASQLPQMIRWMTPVDLAPPGGTIYIHYGSPIITRSNTVLVPVKNGNSYQVTALNATTGTSIWTAASDFTLPAHDWVPIFGISLTPKDKYVVYPGAGGTVYGRTFPDTTAGTTTQFIFYNTPTMDYYHSGANSAAEFDAAIQICTPISSDASGNLYFGYISSGAALPGYPNGIPSGLARISSTGIGSFVSATSLSGGDTAIQKVAYNCSPCFSADETTLYVAVNNGTGRGYLCAVNTTTLARKSSVLLMDPQTPAATAYVDDDGSATPTVGPDGDVYYGVLSTNISNNDYRGFLLHFDSKLSTSKTPGAFGWDDTASIVPTSAVPSYTGTSPYLLLTKYNNYANAGSGLNQVAVLDPNVMALDPTSGIMAMKPVIAVTGITPDPDFATTPGAVREWCINSAAIDAINQCAVINSEDGHVYRWSFVTNTLSPGLKLANATSEAYTPTVIGPDGAVYAINDAVLYSCVANPAQIIASPPGLRPGIGIGIAK